MQKYMERKVHLTNTLHIFTTEHMIFGFRVLTSINLICLVMIFKIGKKKKNLLKQTRHLLDIELGGAEVSEAG